MKLYQINEMYHEIGFKYTSRPPREIGKPQAHHASRRQEGIEAAASAQYITGRRNGLCPFRGNLRSGWKRRAKGSGREVKDIRT